MLSLRLIINAEKRLAMSTASKSIKRLRIQNNMTQDQLAEILHVSRQAISYWETGKTQPDIDKPTVAGTYTVVIANYSSSATTYFGLAWK